MGVQFGQPLCFEGEYSGRAFIRASQSNAQEVVFPLKVDFSDTRNDLFIETL